MKNKKNTIIVALLSCVIGVAGPSFLPSSFASSMSQPQNVGQSAGQPSIAKRVGAIKTISGNVLTLAADSSGPEITVTVQPSARLLRLGADKDLKNATPVQLQDLQVGDTIRARGQASDDGKSIAALEIIVITRSAVQAVSDQIRQDWQKRGLAGIVASVDPASGTVTISIPSFGEKKTVTVHTSSSTVIRRYASDSANFEAATASTLQHVHVDDQLRARGDRSSDGNDFTAVEIVTGTFPYVEGTIKSVDASANTITVQDVLSKKTVQLKVTADSQLHQVPADAAQRMAFMLKRAKSQGGTGPSASGSSAWAGNAAGNQAGPPSGGMAPGGAGGGAARAGGASGLQRMLDQTPSVTLAALHKGDALAILATEGAASGSGTIIKLYSGVEPILEAAPNAMMLAPWSLGGAPGGDSGQ